MKKIIKFFYLPLEGYALIAVPIILVVLMAIAFKTASIGFLERKLYNFNESFYKDKIKKGHQKLKVNYPTNSLKAQDIIDTFTLKPFKEKKQSLKRKTPPPIYHIQAIYIGEKKYAIINGKIFEEGDKISDKERIVRIERDRVLLDGYWGKRWIYLLD